MFQKFGLVALTVAFLASLAFGRDEEFKSEANLQTRAKQAENHWIDAWTSMPQLTETSNLPPAPFVSVQFRSNSIH
jgi:hypothetical protein